MPKKDGSKHIGLDKQDIPGANPKSVYNRGRGLKRKDFFPMDRALNDYYNKETHGGNVSDKGHLRNDNMEYSIKPSHYPKKHVPGLFPELSATKDSSRGNNNGKIS